MTIKGGTINVKGCRTDSIQGNVAFANVMEQMRATVTWTSESITVTRDPNVGLTGVSSIVEKFLMLPWTRDP